MADGTLPPPIVIRPLSPILPSFVHFYGHLTST